MPKENLQEYISKSRELGIDDVAILFQLRQAGWQEKDILEVLSSVSHASGALDAAYQVKPRNRRIAFFTLLVPLIGYHIFSAVHIAESVVFQLTRLMGMEFGSSAPPFYIGNEPFIRTGVDPAIAIILNLFFTFLGFVAVAGIAIGIIFAVILFKKKELVSGVFDQRSGKGKGSVIPEEIKGWSWGAFGIPIMWGIYHRAWVTLWGLLLIGAPFILVGMLWQVYVGVKGNEWAWRKNTWESVEQFKAAQHKWKPWGIVLFVAFYMLPLVISLFWFLDLLKR